MTKSILTLSAATVLFLTSCNETTKQDEVVTTDTEMVDSTPTDVNATSVTNAAGEKIDITYDNIKGSATVLYNGETVELPSQKPASGFWYKNDNYELRGKGNDLTLTKDGKVIYEHTDDVQTAEAKNDKGETLNMTFNNSDGTLKAYLNGGDQIDLKQVPSGSGFWYKNDQYELRGKGEEYELKKDGKIVFDNFK